MSDTRNQIVVLGDRLIRLRGYNAFSYHDISSELKIKNAAVHYHFKSKEDLGIEIIKNTFHLFQLLKEELKNDDFGELQKLNAFLDIYSKAKNEEKVCLVGALAPAYYTLPESMQKELNKMAHDILNFVADLLEKGREKHVFFFTISAQTKALLIITNMIASLQINRLLGKNGFDEIRDAVVRELTTPNIIP